MKIPPYGKKTLGLIRVLNSISSRDTTDPQLNTIPLFILVTNCDVTDEECIASLMQLVAKKTQNLTITLRHYFHNL